MRVLLINQFFYPDDAPTGQLLGDLALHLAGLGHEVITICGPNGYASVSLDELPGIRVIRSRSLPFSRGLAQRVLSYLSFIGPAIWHSLRIDRPDVVVTLTTPPLLPFVGSLVRTLRGSRHFIWEMDLFPDTAVAMGMMKPDSLLSRFMAGFGDFSRRRADGLIALGPCMRDRLRSHGLDASRIHVVDNWAPWDIRPEPLPAATTAAKAPVRVLYSGNLGMAHDTATICDTMRSLRDEVRIQFEFAGGGARRKEVEQFCKHNQLERVVFRSYEDRDKLSASLAACDIGLVTQLDGSEGTVVPSKLYSLMAAARPILYIGPASATAAVIIDRFGCGWRVANGDSTGLTSLLRRLAAEPEQLALAGQRAREAYVEQFDRPIGLAKLTAVLGLEQAK